MLHNRAKINKFKLNYIGIEQKTSTSQSGCLVTREVPKRKRYFKKNHHILPSMSHQVYTVSSHRVPATFSRSRTIVI